VLRVTDGMHYSQQGVLLFDPCAEVSVIRDRELFAGGTADELFDGGVILGVEGGGPGVSVQGEGRLVPPFTSVSAKFVPGGAANLLADVDVKKEFKIERVY
jgi:hypothetical protein